MGDLIFSPSCARFIDVNKAWATKVNSVLYHVSSVRLGYRTAIALKQ